MSHDAQLYTVFVFIYFLEYYQQKEQNENKKQKTYSLSF